jgi:hypothetical protein
MAKLLKKPDKPLPPEDPDAWERFESAVDALMKAGPQHRQKPQTPSQAGEDHE